MGLKEVIPVFDKSMFSVLDRRLVIVPQGYFCPNLKAEEYFKKKLGIGKCRACGEVFIYPLCGDLGSNKHSKKAWGIYMSIINLGFSDGLDLCLECRVVYRKFRKKKAFFRRRTKKALGPSKSQVDKSFELGLSKERVSYV